MCFIILFEVLKPIYLDILIIYYNITYWKMELREVTLNAEVSCRVRYWIVGHVKRKIPESWIRVLFRRKIADYIMYSI